MKWHLAHRPCNVVEFATATIDAPTSWAAVERLRAEIPAAAVVLYVRADS